MEPLFLWNLTAVHYVDRSGYASSSSINARSSVNWAYLVESYNVASSIDTNNPSEILTAKQAVWF